MRHDTAKKKLGRPNILADLGMVAFFGNAKYSWMTVHKILLSSDGSVLHQNSRHSHYAGEGDERRLGKMGGASYAASSLVRPVLFSKKKGGKNYSIILRRAIS